MDGFRDFRKHFGAGAPYRDWGPADAERLAGKIPPVMQRILETEGWCSYADGLVWLCDPDDWETVAGFYADLTPNARVLARTAFGDLFLWDGSIFWSLMVHESLLMWVMDDADWFFSRILTNKDFAPGPFKEARKLRGRLEWDEMYTYVPALALGGSGEASTIEKVKIRENLAILADLQPIERA